MKSLEVKFAEALAELKKVSAKQYDAVFAECQKLPTIETKLNAVEAALLTVKESGNPDTFSGRVSTAIEQLEEAKRDHAILFGVAPRQTTTTNNERAPIKKHNGAAENFVEGSPFNGDRGNVITERNTEARKDIFAKGDKVLKEALGITEAKPSSEYDKLTEGQKKEFDFARAIGISEADAFRLVKITGGYKQVSRR